MARARDFAFYVVRFTSLHPPHRRRCTTHRRHHRCRRGHVRPSRFRYVHEYVPGIAEKSAAVARATRATDVPPSRLVRHTLPAARLRRWTAEALATLRATGAPDAAARVTHGRRGERPHAM